MPAGRPSKYKPEFCETILQVGAEGGWLSEMAEACDVHRSTMDEWAKSHPEFSEALTRAKQKAQAWFEKTGRTGLTADKFNSSLWAKQMSSRHPDEYTDKVKNEHSADQSIQGLLASIAERGKPLVKPDDGDNQP